MVPVVTFGVSVQIIYCNICSNTIIWVYACPCEKAELLFLAKEKLRWWVPRDGFSLLLVFLVIIKWSGQNRKCIFTACTSRTCLKIHCEIMFETKIILPRDHDSFLCLFCFYLLDLHWINVLNSVFKQLWYFIIPQKKKKKIMGGLSLRELFFSERVISLWNFEPLGPLSEHYVWKAKIIEQGWQRRLPLGTRENGVSGLSLKTTKYPKKIKEKKGM